MMSATGVKTTEINPAQNLQSLMSLPHLERTYWRGTTIYALDDPATHIYSVNSGRVKILRASANGRHQIIAIRYRGDIFGELALAGGASLARRSDEAVALDTTRVAVIRAEDFWRVTANDPAMAQDALGCLTRRLDRAHRQIESLVFDDNPRRLIRTLFDLSSEAARAGEASVRLTHEEIAGLIGSAREVVTGLMLDLRRRGLIDYKRGEVCPCLPKLARFLEADEEHGEWC